MQKLVCGINEASLDSKMRVSIPADFRKGIKNETVYALAVFGLHPHIDFFDGEEDYLNEVNKRQASLSKFQTESDKDVMFFGNSQELVIDKQGRTSAISQRLLKLAKIKKDVCFAGSRTYFSMYDTEVYNKFTDELNKMAEDRERARQEAIAKDNAVLASGAYIEIPASNGGMI